MKRLICILFSVLLLVLLPSCAKTRQNDKLGMQQNKEMPYTIKENNGEYFLTFKENSTAPASDDSQQQLEAILSVSFDTFEEMISDINTGNFTEVELEIIRSWSDTDGEVEIPDLSTLYAAEYPSSFDSHEIKWISSRYCHFMYESENGTKAFLYFIDQEEYEGKIDHYKNFDQRTTCEVTSVYSDTERNAAVYEYITNAGAEYKCLFYTVGEGTEKMYISEIYDKEEIDTVPNHIRVFGQYEGVYFYVFMNCLVERPSVEWLSQFGIHEYVETEVA